MARSEKNKPAKKPKKSSLKIGNYSHVDDTMQIIYGVKDAVAKGVDFMKNVEKKMDLCYDKNAPSIVLNVPDYRNGYADIKQRGGKIRVITEITRDNFESCKELMKIVDDMRHLDNVQGGTAISETEYMATNILHESKPLTQVVYSNVYDIVEQQQKFFNSLWGSSVPAKQKIKEFSRRENSGTDDLFSVLSNRTRRLIIFYLSESEMRMSEISKNLGMSLQALQKHLPKLIKAKIIQKKYDGNLSLTETGRILTKSIPSTEFLNDNSDYLNDHSFSSLPTQFLQRIDDLENFEILSKSEFEKKYECFLNESDEYLKIMSVENHFDLNHGNISKILDRKVMIFEILGKNCILPASKLDDEKSKKKNSDLDDLFETKMISNVPLLACVSEKASFLVCLHENGSPDFDNVLWSKDGKFVSWCADLFDHFWRSI